MVRPSPSPGPPRHPGSLMVGEPDPTPTYAKVPHMRYPSVKTLLEVAGNEGRSAALAARKILDGRTVMKDQWDREIPRHSLDEAKMAAADKVLGTHGVEWLTFECDRDNYSNPDGFSYCNAGDTYNATLVLYNGRFRVTTWGDMVEHHEKHCAACRKRSREEG